MKGESPMKITSLLSLAAALSVVAVGRVCHCADPDSRSEDGLVAYWRFDEDVGETVKDSSGRGHDGKIVGEARRVQGRVGKAVYVGGQKGSGVVIPDADDLNCTAAITVETWIKPDKLTREATYDIISKGGDRGPGYRLLVSWAALRMRSGEGPGKDCWEVAGRFALTPMTWGIWHHVAATYDGQVYKLYLDGIEVADGGMLRRGKDTTILDGAAHPITVDHRPLSIGSYSGGYAYVFRGAIDEVKIFSRAKSAAEVFQSAKGCGPDVDSERVGHRFGEPEVHTQTKERALQVEFEFAVANGAGKPVALRLEGSLIPAEGKPQTTETKFSFGETEEKKTVRLSGYTVDKTGDYKLLVALTDPTAARVYCRTQFPVRLEYTPLAIRLVQPCYRDSIYASQQIDEVKLLVDVGLEKKALETSTLVIRED
jgi:hypothetical protein